MHSYAITITGINTSASSSVIVVEFRIVVSVYVKFIAGMIFAGIFARGWIGVLRITFAIMSILT